MAKLVLESQDVGHVDVQRKDANEFHAGKPNQKLHEGDVVRTDDVGHAEIDYTDDSYIRVST